MRDWARTLPPGATVLDIGCGSGLPIAKALVDAGLNVYAVDAAPVFVEAFRRNFPDITVACEAAEESPFFGRMFDGIISWGLIFPLDAEEQRRLIRKAAAAHVPGGRFLFTSCAEPFVWNDAMTGLESRSLGAPEYRSVLSSVGLSVLREYEDVGENHYYDSRKDLDESLR